MRSTRDTARGFLGVMVLVTTACSGGRETHAFIERLGSDTMSVEIFTHSGNEFQGDVLVRSPVTRVAHYSGLVAADGSVARFRLRWETPIENPDGPPPEEYAVTVVGTTAIVEALEGADPGVDTLDIPSGAFPVTGNVPNALGIVHLMVHSALSAGVDSFPLATFRPGTARVATNALTRHSEGMLTMDFFGAPMMIEIDGAGEITGRSGAETTMKVEADRIDPPDLMALASEFAGRDARGEGLGVASPSAETRVQIGDATFAVRYSQPAKRGRVIFGGLVPLGTVWRTGANAATHFSTSTPIRLGDVELAAGTYTLWSTYTADTATLIINSQTDIWGTAHDAQYDVGSTTMMWERTDETTERFTITVEPVDEGAVLRMAWDDSRFTVPIRIP